MAMDDVFGKDALIPPAEPPTVELLNKMLHEGIEALLKNAEEVSPPFLSREVMFSLFILAGYQEDVLEPPYGHKQPATLIDLELDADDEVGNKGLLQIKPFSSHVYAPDDEDDDFLDDEEVLCPDANFIEMY